MAVDRSNGPNHGTFYLVWGNKGISPDRADIHFSKSTDGGTTWSNPLRVNDDNTTYDQWHPWITVSPLGRISIVFYDSRNDNVPPVNQMTGVWLAQSTDGGVTFANSRVSDIAFSPVPFRDNDMGDFIGITSRAGVAYPAWADNRYRVGEVDYYQVFMDVIETPENISVPLLANWNMLSLPLADPQPDNVFVNLFPTSSFPYAFEFVPGTGYQQRTSLENRKGYWGKFPAATTQTITGMPRDSFHIGVSAGWNIIGSVWDEVDTARIAFVNTTRTSGYFGYASGQGYYYSNTIEPGRGYWLKVSANGTLILDRNAPLSSSSTPCTPPPPSPEGEPAAPSLVSPPDGATGVATSPTLSWNASGGATSYRLQVLTNSDFGTTVYDQSDITATSQQVGPLSGNTTFYWRVNAANDNGESFWACTRKFTTGIAPESPGDPDQFVIADASANRQTVFAQPGIGDVEMPPVPPAGMFDARFQSGNFIEGFLANQSYINLPIVVQNAMQPITLSWDINAENGTDYWIAPPGALNDTLLWISLGGSGSMAINTVDGVVSLVARAGGIVGKPSFKDEGLSSLPTEYALEQNYPNPFNPTTNIKFALPVDSRVTIEIYSVLGQKVRTLLNEDRPAGYYTIEWSGIGDHVQPLGSGVYLLRLTAIGTNGEIFNHVRKLVMLR